MTAAPEVTVVIPTKDRPELLQRALATALAQEDVTLEIVVVDDGSRPPADLSGAGPRVRRVVNDVSMGVAAARNRGIFEASGRWVAFLDDDDLWAPGKLRAQLDEMERSGADWSHTGIHWLNEDLSLKWTTRPQAAAISAAALCQANTVGTPSGVVASAEALRTVGGFDVSFSIFADWDLWLRLADVVPGVALAAPLLGYVTHSASMHRDRTRRTIQEMRVIERRHRHRGDVGGLQMWHWIAASRRDAGHFASAALLHLAIGLRWRDRRSLRAAAGALADAVRGRRRPYRTAAEPLPTWVTSSLLALQEARA